VTVTDRAAAWSFGRTEGLRGTDRSRLGRGRACVVAGMGPPVMAGVIVVAEVMQRQRERDRRQQHGRPRVCNPEAHVDSKDVRGSENLPWRRTMKALTRQEANMSRLIRMDETGHTTLAEWTADDEASVEAAVAALRAELDQGYFAVVSTGEGHAEQVRELPLEGPLVILRRPIAGG
jgi:hypothetical protein